MFSGSERISKGGAMATAAPTSPSTPYYSRVPHSRLPNSNRRRIRHWPGDRTGRCLGPADRMKAMIVERVSNADNTGYALRAGINRPYQAKISTAGRYTFAGHLKITVSN